MPRWWDVLDHIVGQHCGVLGTEVAGLSGRFAWFGFCFIQDGGLEQVVNKLTYLTHH